MNISGVGGHSLHRYSTTVSSGLYQPPAASHIAVKPSGKQNLSISSPPTGSTNKLSSIAAHTRNVLAKASYLTLLAMKLTKHGYQAKTGSYSLPNEGFKRSFKAFVGINIAFEGLQFIKSAGETVYHAVRDIAAHKDRQHSQALLHDYDPERRSFKSGSHNQASKAELQQLLSKKGSDLSRSKGQITLDRLSQTAALAEPAVGITLNALLIAESGSKAAASAVPGVGIALTAIGTLYSAIKTASQVSALNNLAKAKSATSDPLLIALSKHIKTERTLQTRKHLVNTAVNAAATAVAVGTLASGVAAPAAFIATGAIGGAVSVGTTAFTVWHNRKLSKAREAADQLMQTDSAWLPIAHKNIGVAERAFLSRLRHSEGGEQIEAVSFLRNFGLTDNTIKKLQLAPEATAMKTLHAVLYQDKVKYKGLQLKQTVKTLTHVVGLTALSKRIKAASLWLAHKLKPARQSESPNLLGHSVYEEPNRPVVRKRFTAIRPNSNKLYPNLQQFQTSRITL